jgi:glutaredoxin 3
MAKSVIVYSSDMCKFCTLAKDFLTEKGVSFEEKNVNKDAEARKEFMEMKMMGVPVILVDNEIVQGFDKDKLVELLGL